MSWPLSSLDHNEGLSWPTSNIGLECGWLIFCYSKSPWKQVVEFMFWFWSKDNAPIFAAGCNRLVLNITIASLVIFTRNCRLIKKFEFTFWISRQHNIQKFGANTTDQFSQIVWLSTERLNPVVKIGLLFSLKIIDCLLFKGRFTRNKLSLLKRSGSVIVLHVSYLMNEFLYYFYTPACLNTMYYHKNAKNPAENNPVQLVLRNVRGVY